MTKENKMRILRIYSILLSIAIVIAGICLIAGCISIYNLGDYQFSREAVAETFSHIAIPVYLCLAMTILGFVIELFIPTPQAKPTIEKPYSHLLSRLYANRDLNQCDASVLNEIASLQKNRKLHSLIRILVLVVASVVFLIYALNGDNFQKRELLNASIIQAMYVLIPCLIVAFAYALFVTIHNEKSIQKEFELIKQIPVLNNPPTDNTDAANTEQTNASDKKLCIIRYAILTIGAVLMIYGICTGGTEGVLGKAIAICTECIGLG